MSRLMLGALACMVVLGAGCAPSLSQNKPREPRRELPASYVGAQPTAAEKSVVEKAWQEFFEDPALRALIEAALHNNQELNIRVQELIIAQNEVMASEGEYLPKLSVGAGAGVDKVAEHTSQGVSDEAHELPSILQNYKFGFSASWEVDIWGKLRNSAKAAALRYLSSVEGRNFVITKLVAEIARSYYELLALDSQLAVLRQNIEIQQNGLQIVRLQKEAAKVTELAVQRFEAELLKNQSKQFDLQQRIVEVENRINFLVGRYPQPVARDARRFEAPLPSSLAVGIPSQLLDHRPDVKQAELDLAAAKLDVQAAKARFYPALSIEAGVGYQAFNVKHLLATPESLIFNLAGNITAPLLNRQAIKAEYYSANALQIQAVFKYEQTLLQAFTEVVNQLAMIDNLDKSYELTSQQVDRLTRSIETSNVLFQSARADYLEVLTTRRDALESQIDLIETRLRQRHALINMYQALGGGWR